MHGTLSGYRRCGVYREPSRRTALGAGARSEDPRRSLDRQRANLDRIVVAPQMRAARRVDHRSDRAGRSRARSRRHLSPGGRGRREACGRRPRADHRNQHLSDRSAVAFGRAGGAAVLSGLDQRGLRKESRRALDAKKTTCSSVRRRGHAGPTAARRPSTSFWRLAYHRKYNLKIVVGRFFNVVGPRQVGHYGMVIPRFVDQALDGGPVVVYDDGGQTRCFAHVREVVDAHHPSDGHRSARWAASSTSAATRR